MKTKYYLLFLLPIAVAVYSPKVDAQVIHTFAGTVAGYSGDSALAIHAELSSCTGVAIDGEGNVYIADKNNNVVRKVSTLGIITTFAGNDTAGYSGNGHLATKAKLNHPYSVATNAAGDVYIADFGNNVIRVVSSINGYINTYAGNDTAGYSGDHGVANHASLYGPEGIAIDGSGNLYIADAGNSVIRKVDPAGIITTIAGNNTVGYSGDNNVATSAQLNSPSGVAVDAFGDVFIADVYNNVVREVIDSTGNIVTYSGNNTPGFAGDNGPATSAQLFFPSSVSLDQAGSVYIADQGNNTIRRVDSLGNISLFAGHHTSGYSGDNGPATSAALSSPIGVTADGWGRIYIADYGNSVVRLVTQGNTGVSSVNTLAQGIKIYPNPASGNITVEIAGAANASIIVNDMLGNLVATANADTTTTTINLANMPAGNYIVKVVNGDKTYVNKIEILKK